MFEVTRDDLVMEKCAEIRCQGLCRALESGVPVEMMKVRMTSKSKSGKLLIHKTAIGAGNASKAVIRTNDCYLANVCAATPMHGGLKLEADNIIQTPTATTVISVMGMQGRRLRPLCHRAGGTATRTVGR